MPYGPKSIAKDLRPINVVRNVSDDTRMAPVTSSGRPGEGYYANPPRDVSGNLSMLPQTQTVYYQSPVPDSATSFLPIGYNNAVPGVAAWVQHVVPSQPNISPTVVSPMVVTSAGGFSYSPTSGAQSASDPASEDGGDDSVSGRKVKFLCSFGGKILPRPSDSSLRYVGGQTRILSVRRDISFGELVQKMVDTYGQDVVIKYQLPEEELDALVSVACPDDVENMMDEYEKLVERSPDGSAKLRIFLFSPSDVESPVKIGDQYDGGCRYVEAVNGVADSFDGARMARNESIESVAVASQTSDLSGTEEITNATSPRMVCVDPNPVLYTDLSGAPVSIPRVQSGTTTVLGAEQAVDRSVPFTVQQSQPGMSFPLSSQYMQAYPDPRQETYNRAAYMQLPPQMGFPGQILGPVGPMYAQQSIPVGGTGVPSQMYTPTAQMTMSPSFVSMKPSAVPVAVQSQQVHRDPYPAGSMMSQRVVQFTTDQGYSTPHSQVSTAVQGGGYNWHQIPQLEPTTLSEDCLMCQKQLPHAHSETVAQELKESCPSVSSDSISSFHSLHLDNRGRPLVKPVVNDVEQFQQQVNDKAILQKVEIPEHSKVTLPRAAPSPYFPFVGNSPHAYQVNSAQHFVPQPQVQMVQDTDQVVRESPKEYYGANVAGGSPKDDSNLLVFDHLRQIDGRLENLQIRPSEILSNNEQNKAMTEIRQAATRENPSMILVESYDMMEPPPSSTPEFYPHPTLGANQFVTNDAPGQPIYLGECQDNILRSQPAVPGGIDTLALLGNNLSSMSPSYGAGDIPDNSASLFSNQDPWSLRHDTHFPPPKPSKIQIRKENPGLRDPVGENRLMNRSESPTGNGRDSPGDGSVEHAGNLNRDLSSNKGSAEEMIKQELQAVAEGVAASVLHSSGQSNADLSVYGADDSPSTVQQNGEAQRANVEVQRRDKPEESKNKFSDKVNLGSPTSDSVGRLQIIRNSDLEELRELGSGTFGTVYHGKWRGTDVAIKRISDRCFAAKPSEQERMRDDFWNEAVNLADLHHPNVVAFYGVVLDGPEGSVATVTEYMVNGSLRNALQKNERVLDKRKRLLIGMDAAFGMEYLHGKNIVHFDLKSDNLLVNLRDPHRPICKVGDLGLSKVKCQTLISGGVRGTLPWMAPELLNGSSSLVSEKVDVFSFGIVMWELLTGDEPYADLHYGAIIGGIVSNTLRPPVPETCDPVWRALMERCWASEPSERPNFTEIANELRAMASKLAAK